MSKLISGKEALIALAHGGEVEYKSINGWSDVKHLHAYEFFGVCHEFRLKPRTITINGIEVPAPFEPNHGDEIWFFNPDYGCGYADGDYDPAESVIQFGAWRTEDEVKQVVAALREVFKIAKD